MSTYTTFDSQYNAVNVTIVGAEIASAKEFNLYLTRRSRNRTYMVFYGLQIVSFRKLSRALDEFRNCLEHALSCEAT